MNFTLQSIMEIYDHLWIIRDKRVDGWPMMSSPWPTISLCTAYIYISRILGPMFMKNRPAYNMKHAMQGYNLFQVIFSGITFYEACAAGWLTGYNWLCQDVDRNPDPDSPGMRMVRACWLYFMGKFLEFCDTFFFLVRKKMNHVSALQVPIYNYYIHRPNSPAS